MGANCDCGLLETGSSRGAGSAEWPCVVLRAKQRFGRNGKSVDGGQRGSKAAAIFTNMLYRDKSSRLNFVYMRLFVSCRKVRRNGA